MDGSTLISIIGVDPGGTTGIATLEFTPNRGWGADAFINVSQVKGPAHHAISLVEALLPLAGGSYNTHWVPVLAVEQFVVSSRASRSSTPKGAQQAREIIGALLDLAKKRGIPIHVRPAGHVKPWATDRRVSALGVDTSGMGHGVDALRHGLFAAVHDYGAPDPLSKRSVSA